ncbi:hypothetical protein MUK42_10578 [Musa troglodytarum]|uniref:Uncharacterized protein n=1 Tax=Musa troglodytarum TaxID=320322 RepID=A0A9E7ERP3_9LILI|nr:hypothetical protein MUK42_10578 [Musa troglodytarum]
MLSSSVTIRTRTLPSPPPPASRSAASHRGRRGIGDGRLCLVPRLPLIAGRATCSLPGPV